MLEYLFIAFVIICCIQLFFYIFIFSFFAFSTKKQTGTDFFKPVSVIICAKNEAKNLQKNLTYYLQQTHPKFELVLVNDGSTDDTLAIMKAFKAKASLNIKILDNKNTNGKKHAISLAIKNASYNYLLFTDADCKPNSNYWISEMSAHFNNQKEIVLGYGAYTKVKSSLLNKLIRFETLITAIQYFSYAKLGIPYMGVGRNLAYTKNIFETNFGFKSHLHIKSGDDDLFINRAATKQNTAICFSNKAHTISTPKTTFKSWIQQKRRHITTASSYKKIHIFLLSTFFISQFLFWGAGIVLIAFQFKWQTVSFFILLKFTSQYFIYGISAKKLNETDLLFWIPFYELFLILTQMFIFIKNLISKPTHW